MTSQITWIIIMIIVELSRRRSVLGGEGRNLGTQNVLSIVKRL